MLFNFRSRLFLWYALGKRGFLMYESPFLTEMPHKFPLLFHNELLLSARTPKINNKFLGA